MTEFTGERVIPGQVEPDLWAEHFSRYRFAAHLSRALGRPLDILDIGCGAGYGTAALAEVASSATGIDLAQDAIDYAQSHYQQPSLRFVPGSATALPFPDASFDLITAFEVIEHLEDGTKLLAEARRVMRPGGVLLVSTPNTTYYSETRAKEGPNPYHLHEFTFEEFTEATTEIFPSSVILLQNHTDAFAFYNPRTVEQVPIDGYFESASGKPSEAHFFLAVCSLQPITHLHNFIYVPTATNLLRTREHHIQLLQDEVTQLKNIVTGVQAELSTTQGQRDTMMRMFDEQHRQLQAQSEWAQQLDRDLKHKSADLKTVVDALDRAEDNVVERTLWAQRLDAQLHACQDELDKIKASVESSRWIKLGRKLGIGPQIGTEIISDQKNDTDV